MPLSLTLTCADYPRLFPLVAGAVQPEGIDLTLQLGRGGSWPDRAKMLQRAASDPTVAGGEGSMARHLRRVEAGDRSLVALPAFPLRNLPARDIYVRRDGPIRGPADLAGCRAGMYSWAASGSIWYRHFLRWLGVAPESMRWCIGNVDASEWGVAEAGLPEGVTTPVAGRSLSEMLADGELDALFSPPRPQLFHQANSPITQLFPDARPIEADYARAFRIWPPQHVIVLRREVWAANTWIAPALTDAFTRNNELFEATQRNFPYASPWLDADLDAADALLGRDAHADGFARNRDTVATFCEEAHRSGIVSRVISPEEYFSDFLES